MSSRDFAYHIISGNLSNSSLPFLQSLIPGKRSPVLLCGILGIRDGVRCFGSGKFCLRSGIILAGIGRFCFCTTTGSYIELKFLEAGLLADQSMD